MTVHTATDDVSQIRAESPMYKLLEATEADVVAVRMHDGTVDGYREFYELLADKTAQYGSIYVYEEATNWTGRTFLSHLAGLIPDIRYGPTFDIERYAAVGDNRWVRLLYELWKLIRPVWPVAPAEMRYFDISDREKALHWVKSGDTL